MEGERKISTMTLIGLVIVLTLIAGLLLSLSNIAKQQRMYSITTFRECADAGYPIMESYPEQCRTPDGRLFVNEEVEQIVPPESGTTTPETKPDTKGTGAKCVRGGCSGQLCVSAAEAEGMVTTCEYRAEYACYNTAKCEVQSDGACGWTQTAELKACLQNPPALQ